MKTIQLFWQESKGWSDFHDSVSFDHEKSQLVLVFGGREVLANSKHYHDIKNKFKNAHILMVSTAGEILGDHVFDDSMTVTAIEFENTHLKIACEAINSVEESETKGKAIASQFDMKDLSYVLILSDGQKVNGTALLKGINATLAKSVIVTGGLAGDGSKFIKTLVGLDNPPTKGQIVAVGFYGQALKVGHGSMGGWDTFGPVRKVTKSVGNVLYQLDNQPALDLYKKYLGDQAKNLPGSALLFPLSIHLSENKANLVRTILSVDEKSKSLTFAGDIPSGARVQLMKANFDRLIDGASEAANKTLHMGGSHSPDLALLISCVGRKLVLGPRAEEEIESVRTILGKSTKFTGFYSYGELSPLVKGEACELHNQTMTITTFSEG
jgi:hypothetical protein